MSKFSNLYDIDGNIINKSPQHRFTIEETEKLVDELTEKVKENPDNEVYKVYLNNTQKWLFKLYNEMSRDELIKRLDLVKNSVEEAKNNATEAEQDVLEQINKAAEELKKEYDNESEDTPSTTPKEGGESELVGEVEQPVAEHILSQEDMLVERESDVNMEETVEL